MASEDEAQVPDHHHEDHEWEAQRENFRICYMDHGLTRKAAAQHMKDQFNFHATPRQWERKIKQWGFNKYSSRDERLSQIAQSGRSVYEVSKPGRRPRIQSDSNGNLLPEDRNLRRFARREVSRSRSRSRSASFNTSQRPQSGPGRIAGCNPAAEPTYNVHFGANAALPPSAPSSFSLATAPAESEPDQLMQMHFLRGQNDRSQPEAPVAADVFVTVNNSQWSQTHIHNLPPGHESFPSYEDTVMSSQHTLTSGAINGNLQYGTRPSESMGYNMGNEADAPTDFNQYSVPGAVPGMPHGLSNEFDSQMFGTTSQNTQDAGAMSQQNFMIPHFQFDLIESAPGPPQFAPNAPSFDTGGPSMDPSFPENSLAEVPSFPGGPLHGDVEPLVEEYTRAVQSAALWCLGNEQRAGAVFETRLATDLDQPRQIFTAKLAVVLENYAKSQQRAVQSMRETCVKLRQKNSVLEAIINSDHVMNQTSVSAADSLPHSSLSYAPYSNLQSTG